MSFSFQQRKRLKLTHLNTGFFGIFNFYWLLCAYLMCLARWCCRENCLPHCPQGNLTPSCTALLCSPRFPLWENSLPHFLHWYLIPLEGNIFVICWWGNITSKNNEILAQICTIYRKIMSLGICYARWNQRKPTWNKPNT